jgi:carboxyl-terminal processing protease
VAQLDKETGVKLTIAQYMTPKNRKIQAVGITPDVLMEEVDQAEFEKDLREDRFIREKDLKNHLTATIETEAEKADRLASERKERLRRIREMEEAKNKTPKKEDEIFRTFEATKDYQVLQAIRYLKGFHIYDDFTKNK